MTTATYQAAITAHNEAIKAFHTVRDAFRARTVDADVFCAARAEYDKATAVFDAAYAVEAALPESTAIEQAATEAIEIAARCSTWGAMASSAALCLDDAVSLTNRGQHAYAYARALDSLRYSVGIFGEAYKAAKALQA